MLTHFQFNLVLIYLFFIFIMGSKRRKFVTLVTANIIKKTTQHKLKNQPKQTSQKRHIYWGLLTLTTLKRMPNVRGMEGGPCFNLRLV